MHSLIAMWSLKHSGGLAILNDIGIVTVPQLFLLPAVVVLLAQWARKDMAAHQLEKESQVCGCMGSCETSNQ